MSRPTDKDKIKAERTKQRKQAKRQHRDNAKAERRDIMLHNAGISLRDIFKPGANDERKHEEEAERNFNMQADELAAQVKAKIEADRAAGRETDLWEWLKNAPCVVTKALRERGISLGKRKR